MRLPSVDIEGDVLHIAVVPVAHRGGDDDRGGLGIAQVGYVDDLLLVDGVGDGQAHRRVPQAGRLGAILVGVDDQFVDGGRLHDRALRYSRHPAGSGSPWRDSIGGDHIDLTGQQRLYHRILGGILLPDDRGRWPASLRQ